MDLKPKPILTYSGDVSLFTSLAPSIIQALPQEPTEWKRSYGRVTKSVRVEASFVPFSPEILPRDGDWQLIKQPIFHIYWTECLDVDIYKTSVRDDIESWLKILTQHNIQDWLIVHVETYDIRKSNKLLPRTTVIDKIRNDFASKQGDRCISVINPVRSESRSAESWRGLLSRIRLLLLTAYNHTLLRFEEAIRDQRERRNVQGWCFCQYFLLQEEMAFVLEMLGVYDEALVQYDELDALFTQFVLNSNAGETAAWLSTFQCQVENWSGLSLKKTGSNQEKRALIKDCKASLLEFRCYLFSRQCAMLLLTLKPWEIAQRSLPFLHNCCKELAILEITCPDGALACWVFLCCLEVLSTCQKFSDSEQVELYSLYTASLWAYARDKLRELGELCGLMPGRQPNSEELHIVVGLSAGMGDPVSGDDKVSTPTDKLKEALSSQAAFKRQYLELAELAMGTYKHIGRIRSARLIGCDLASFYLRVGDTQKASVFLSDALRMFEDENWHSLVLQTRLQLADCYKAIPDDEKFVKMCSVIASSPELDLSTRMSYFEQMTTTLEKMKPETPLDTVLDNSFKIVGITINPGLMGTIIEDSLVLISVELDCLFPAAVHCTTAEACLESFKEAAPPPAKPAEDKRRRPSTPLHNGSGDVSDLSIGIGPPSRQLHMVEHLDFKEDKSLSSASIVAQNPREFLRRTDSSNKYKKGNPIKRDFTRVGTKCKFTLTPGLNKFTLEYKANEIGMFRVSQISLIIAHSMNFLSSAIEPAVNFKVCSEATTVTLNKGDKDLLTGLMQEMVLTVKTGSLPIEENTALALNCTRGLKMQVNSSSESLTATLTVSIPHTEPFCTTTMVLKVLADLPQQKDSHSIEHKVNIVYPWSQVEEVVPLHFQPPLMSSFRLHTAQTRKFAQVVVVGLNVQMLELSEPELTCLETQVKLTPLNPGQGQKLVVCDGINVSFLWQLDVGLLDGSSPIKLVFGVKYAPVPENPSQNTNNELDSLEKSDPDDEDLTDGFRPYKCLFEVKNYKTLIVVGARVEPTKGSGEFCRAGTMCHLLLSVEGVSQSTHNSLMYEVLADQAMWAVCGRTAGVIALDNLEKQTVTLDVMPLIGGFLPLPLVRLSKYIPAVEQKIQGKDGTPRKTDVSMPTNHPRLEPFSPGQVYNSSKSQQVHVLPAITPNMQEHSLT